MNARTFPKTVRVVASLLVIGVFLSAFGWGVEATGWVGKTQFGPAVAQLFVRVAWWAVVAVVAVLAVTALFGRVYCAAFCPLGILQDFLGWLARRPGHREPNWRLGRWTIAALAFGTLAGGWTLGFRLLEPYSNFGAIASATTAQLGHALGAHPDLPVPVVDTTPSLATHDAPVKVVADEPAPAVGDGGAAISATEWKVGLAGLVPLALLAVLVFWKKRVFCAALCPVGTVLGLVAARGVWRMRFAEGCVACGRCESACPTGCVDSEAKTLDNERCVRCMNCMAVCRLGGVVWTAGHAKEMATVTATEAAVPPTVDGGTARRRDFLAAGGMLALSALGVRAMAKAGGVAPETLKDRILPPGAITAERFAARCTSCQLCVGQCRGRVLRPAGFGAGGVVMDYELGACVEDCNRCVEVCPTGALAGMDLAQKKRWQIGQVVFDPKACVAVQDFIVCAECSKHCPTGAIKMVNFIPEVAVPVVTPELCNGCGQCQYVCPARPRRAMRVMPVAEQRLVHSGAFDVVEDRT